ncbi:MAG: malto-oligosyltrehalose synthase, partial [Candidatus Ancillula sp.]|nr:malto-oligosyltrehalose synthase [Candidatus Ancillula sp.]
KDFTFKDVEKHVAYFESLGISHLYLSPILQAVPGSTHGYDVIDHSKVSDDLGGINALRKLAKTLHKHKMGIILDIVPNHMALPTPAWFNHQLWDVLYKGADSCYANWFDVNWDSSDAKLVLPVLKARIGDVVKNGEFEINKMEVPKSATNKDADKVDMTVLKYHEHVFPVAKGTENLPIFELLESQHYRLAYSVVGDQELNYRRFFDIGTLVALRMEDESVFDQTHKVIVKLVKDGIVDGLRIDHIDGLSDPKQYLDRLSEATGGVWTVVEKILSPGEELEDNWKTVGTTGYDSLNMINYLMNSFYGQSILRKIARKAADQRQNSAIRSMQVDLANLDNIDMNDIGRLIDTSKRQVIRSSLYAEVHNLTNLADYIFRNDPELNDHSWRTIYNCLVEVLVAFDRYRAYVRLGKETSRASVNALNRAFSIASTKLDQDSQETLKILKKIVLGQEVGSILLRDDKARQRFIITFQQVSTSIMAKGVEDTSFYRYTALTSLCEVGSDISTFGASEHEFHNYAIRIQNRSPYTMTAGTTHDTKRSEDVRAIISILSQFPEDWEELLTKLKVQTAKYSSPFIDPSIENIMWQTILGTWTPDGDNAGPISYERLSGYLIKVMREAKTHTTWLKPNLPYEDAILNLAKSALADGEVLDMYKRWIVKHVLPMQSAILATKAVQLTMPGVADIYQGTERLSLSLVDPDNRRPVDFDKLEHCLKKVQNPDFDPNLPSGDTSNPAIDYSHNPATINERKMLVTYAALQLRLDYPDAFIGSRSGYLPISVSSDCAFGFTRTVDDKPQVITLVTRYSGALARNSGWGNHFVYLPSPPSGFKRWVDKLTGKTYKKGQLKLVEIFEKYPVALLEPVRSGVKKDYVEIWAPTANKISLYLAQKGTYSETMSSAEAKETAEYRKMEMVRYSDLLNQEDSGKEGWFRSSKPIKIDQDYLIRVNDGERVPDPRSNRQVMGVDGFSRKVDLDNFRFTDTDWTGIDPKGKVFYELHIGTFTEEGTFDAAVMRLSELKALGVEIVEVMPVSTFDGQYGWGYDGVDLYSVFEPYGGVHKLQKFVNEAHNMGLGVCLDVVYNHLGPTGDYLNQIGPYYTDKHITPWGKGFNFDQENNFGVRQWVIDHVTMLFEKYHIDALRLDATHEIQDDSEEHILTEISRTVDVISKNTGRQLSLIAESDSNSYTTVKSTKENGWGMTMQWADDFHHALYTYLTKECRSYYKDFGTFDILKTALKHGWVYQGQYSEFRKKEHGSVLPEDFDLRRFVVCFSNHDQVGNRGMGDRPSSNLNLDQLKIAATLTLLSPFSPLIFEGEEWGASSPFQFFADYTSEVIQDACREGRKNEFKEFGWEDFYRDKFKDVSSWEPEIPDPISIETFKRCKLDWEERQTGAHFNLLTWYFSLLTFRRLIISCKNRPITAKDIKVDSAYTASGDVLFYQHSGTLIAINFSNDLYEGDTSFLETDKVDVRLQSKDENIISENYIKLAPQSVIIAVV